MHVSMRSVLAAVLLLAINATACPKGYHSRRPHTTLPTSVLSSTTSSLPAPTEVAVSVDLTTSASVAATTSTSEYAPSTTSASTSTTSTSTSAAATVTAAASASDASSSLTSDQQAALDAQNAARSDVGEAPLAWSDSLSADAQTWATRLVSVGSLVHSGVSGQGENLYWQSNSPTPFANAADAWVSEKSKYNGEAIGEGDFESYGHYTQVIWNSTTQVGMAAAEDGNGGFYVVARYTPPGNYVGEIPTSS